MKRIGLWFSGSGSGAVSFWLGKPAIVREQEIQAMKELQEEKYKKSV